MGNPDHPNASDVKASQILEVAIKGVRAFEPKQRAYATLAIGPGIEQSFEVFAGTDCNQVPIRPFDRVTDFRHLNHCATKQTGTTQGAPAERSQNAQDVRVSFARCVDVPGKRDLGRHGKELQPYAALNQPREIHMSKLGKLKQVPAHERSVCVHVQNKRSTMQATRVITHGRKHMGFDSIDEPLDILTD
jgi:hypothetical protein